jgi:hypothetical protein
VLAIGIRLSGALESVHAADVVHGDLRAADICVTSAGEPVLTDFGIAPLVDLYGSATPARDVHALAVALQTVFGGAAPQPVADVLHTATDDDPTRQFRHAADFGAALQNAQRMVGLPPTEMTVAARPSMPRTRRSRNTPLVVAAIIGVIALVASVVFFAGRDNGTSDAARTVKPASTFTSPPPPTTTPSTTSTTSPAPDTFTQVTNDGGNVAIEVPTSWNQTDGANLANDIRDLAASNNLLAFTTNDYATHGVEVRLFSPSQISPADLDKVVQAVLVADRDGGAFETVCQPAGNPTDLFGNESGLIGRVQRLDSCGGKGDVVVAVATTPARSVTAIAIVNVGSPSDEPAAERVLRSMTIVKYP